MDSGRGCRPTKRLSSECGSGAWRKPTSMSARRGWRLFGVVLVTNALIGIAQELRAKLTLDRLAVLTAPRVRGIRDGAPRDAAVADLAPDDLADLPAADQLAADAVVRAG